VWPGPEWRLVPNLLRLAGAPYIDWRAWWLMMTRRRMTTTRPSDVVLVDDGGRWRQPCSPPHRRRGLSASDCAASPHGAIWRGDLRTSLNLLKLD